jgi:23S rRNA pseudouridine1911/1915/1917 synthase
MNRDGFTIDWTIEEQNDGMLLREYLRIIKKISKSALTDIKFHGGSIFVNGADTTVRYKLKQGDRVMIQFPPEDISEAMDPEEVNFDILLEDEHFLIVNKPAGIPTIPSRYHTEGSLAQGVLHYYQNTGIAATFHAVNRLDRDTSGIVLVAKHRYAHYLLSLQQQDKTLTREYLALVHGVPVDSTGIIKKPIGRKLGSIIERAIKEDGQYAETHFNVIRKGESSALISLKLKTGRTHQIRVHMSSVGHPLIGDDLYGGQKGSIDRQALHSWKVNFFHPFDEMPCSVEAPIPHDMKQIIETL